MHKKTFKGIKNVQYQFFSKETQIAHVCHTKFGYEQANRGENLSCSSLFESTSVDKLSLHMLMSLFLTTPCLEYIEFYSKWMGVGNAAHIS